MIARSAEVPAAERLLPSVARWHLRKIEKRREGLPLVMGRDECAALFEVEPHVWDDADEAGLVPAAIGDPAAPRWVVDAAPAG